MAVGLSRGVVGTAFQRASSLATRYFAYWRAFPSPRVAHGRDGRLLRAELAIFVPVDEFPLPDPASENGFP
jgi:hypothetical protein